MSAVKLGYLNGNNHKILAIDTKYISTSIALYEDNELILNENIRHPIEKIKKFTNMVDELEYRYKLVKEVIQNKKLELSDIKGIVAKGGLVRPIESGTYIINEKMFIELKEGKYGEDYLNLGSMIAYKLFKEYGILSYMVDPVVVDEMDDIAKITGIKEIKRKSYFHALSQKAVAKKFAHEHHKRYEQLNLIVAHIGSGITVGAHKAGRVIDVNNGLEGEGPFSPERSGSLPITDLIKMCFNGNYTHEEIREHINGKGGCIAYFNHSDVRDILKNVKKGDEKYRIVFEAMGYQIVKEIGKCAVVLEGYVDEIILTGGLAYCIPMINYIKGKIGSIASISVYPGKDEIGYLVEGVLRILRGEERIKYY